MTGMETGGQDASTALLGVHFDDGIIRSGFGPNQGCSGDSILLRYCTCGWELKFFA